MVGHLWPTRIPVIERDGMHPSEGFLDFCSGIANDIICNPMLLAKNRHNARDSQITEMGPLVGAGRNPRSTIVIRCFG
jgi:hypothetical protein